MTVIAHGTVTIRNDDARDDDNVLRPPAVRVCVKAKLLCVYDEGSLPDTSLIGAKGLSILADVDGEQTLFDTGMRKRYFAHNSEHLDIDIGNVKRVVISHTHKEHTGGLPAFTEARKEKIEVLVPPDGERPQIKKLFGIPVRKGGLPEMPEEDAAKMDIRIVNQWTQLSPHLFVTAPSAGGGTQEEMSLVLIARGGAVLICGCCHHGIKNTVAYVEEMTGKKVTAVIGGLHLTGMKKAAVHEVAETLKGMGPPALHLSHCSGHVQRTWLREILGLDAVKEFYAGTEIKFDI